nr:hypothetical protein [Tanacetum cinerariifolium]
DVDEEEVFEVVTNAKMNIDAVFDVGQVTTVIIDIPVSAVETIVTTALTITAETTKINVQVTQAPKRKGVMIQEPEETTTIKIASSQQPQVQDKGEEQQELNEEEKAKLFMELLEKRRKFFVAKRNKEKINRPPTKAPQKLFDKAMKRVNTFVDFRTELVEANTKKDEAETAKESSLKRTGEELEEERSNKQKVKDDKESKELKQCLEIIPDDGDDVTIDATPLSSKSSTIVYYKIYKEGKKTYF